MSRWRYAHRGVPLTDTAQWWPVYKHRPAYPLNVTGGVCPPDMSLQPVQNGWSCSANGLGQESTELTSAASGQLAATMVLRGAVGTLVGAAAGPKGSEGIWGSVGFVMGATLGEIGIVGVALAALWRKA